jgi:hypothetical protein
MEPVGCIKIEVKGGCVVKVSNLPNGWFYEIIDHDDEGYDDF